MAIRKYVPTIVKIKGVYILCGTGEVVDECRRLRKLAPIHTVCNWDGLQLVEE
jgi:hypothetical protein